MQDTLLYIIGAKRTSYNKIRFVFVMPTPDQANIMDGDGAILEVADFADIIASNNQLIKPSLIEAYFEELIGAGGPIKCGIGICGNEFQIVSHGDVKMIVGGRGRLFTYLANVDISKVDEAE